MTRRERMERVLIRYGGVEPAQLASKDDALVGAMVDRLKRCLVVPDNPAELLPVKLEELR